MRLTSRVNVHANEPLNQLFQHGPDTPANRLLWPNNTALVSAPGGMSGNAERITDDVGSSSEERVFFDQASSTHLYATWLFNMANTPQDIRLFFMNGSDSNQEGPRIDIEDRDSGTRAAVRAGGSSASEAQIYVDFEQTFRIG